MSNLKQFRLKVCVILTTISCIFFSFALMSCVDDDKKIQLTASNFKEYLSVSVSVDSFEITQEGAQYLGTAIIKIELKRKGNFNFEGATITIDGFEPFFASSQYRQPTGIRKNIDINIDYNGTGYCTVAFEREQYSIPSAPTLNADRIKFGTVVGSVIKN